MVLNVVKTYQGSETRRITPDEHPTFVGVKGDTDTCVLKFVIPATHSAYAKQIRFDVKLTDAEGNECIPTYDLTDNTFDGHYPARFGSAIASKRTVASVMLYQYTLNIAFEPMLVFLPQFPAVAPHQYSVIRTMRHQQMIGQRIA